MISTFSRDSGRDLKRQDGARKREECTADGGSRSSSGGFDVQLHAALGARQLLEVLAVDVRLRHGLQLVVVDRLRLDQTLGHVVEERLVLGERGHGPVVGALHQLLHLAVEDGLRVDRGRPRGEGARVARLPRHRRVAHGLHREAPLRHHPSRDGAHLLQVVGGAGGDLVLAVDDLLGDAAAQRDGELALEVALRVHAALEALLRRREEREAARAVGARDDGHLGHHVVVGREQAHDGMARLVVGHELLPGGEGGARGLGHADGHAVDGVVDLLVADLLLAVTRGHDGGLVHQVGERGAREADGTLGDDVEVELLGEGLAAHVHVQDLTAALDVGKIDRHAAIEAAGADEGGVEHVGAVGRGEHDDARVAVEAVHLGQDLVERLLALVVAAAAHATALAARAGTADGVDLVDEDNARRVLLGLLEEVAHARGADADEHLDELGAGGRDEGHARLAGHRARQQSLTGTGGTLHDGTARDLGAEGRVLGRVLEEVDDLGQLLLGAVAAGHVLEGHARVGLHLDLRLGLADLHLAHGTAAACN
eukprot:scaffold84837_cov55-Phaeocystis_antarctica.AAC.2